MPRALRNRNIVPPHSAVRRITRQGNPCGRPRLFSSLSALSLRGWSRVWASCHPQTRLRARGYRSRRKLFRGGGHLCPPRTDASCHVSDRTNDAAESTWAGATHLVGLRCIDSLPSKSPKTCCMSRESFLRGRPARSCPVVLIHTARWSRRLPLPPLTRTNLSFWRANMPSCLTWKFAPKRR